MLSVSSSQLKSPSLTSKSSNLQSLCQRRFALTRELAQIAARGLAREAWIWGLPVKEFIGQCARSGLSCFSGKSVISFKCKKTKIRVVFYYLYAYFVQCSFSSRRVRRQLLNNNHFRREIECPNRGIFGIFFPRRASLTKLKPLSLSQ